MAYRYAGLLKRDVDYTGITCERYRLPTLAGVVTAKIKSITLASAPEIGGDEVYQKGGRKRYGCQDRRIKRGDTRARAGAGQLALPPASITLMSTLCIPR